MWRRHQEDLPTMVTVCNHQPTFHISFYSFSLLLQPFSAAVELRFCHFVEVSHCTSLKDYLEASEMVTTTDIWCKTISIFIASLSITWRSLVMTIPFVSQHGNR